MKRRQGYIRPIRGWWLRDPYYITYMAREASAVLVAAYAFVLLAGLFRLSQGQAAYDGWLAAMRSPIALMFHGLVFATFVYHTWTWFRIMPKTLPHMSLAGRRVKPVAITAAGLVAAVVASLLLIVFVARTAS